MNKIKSSLTELIGKTPLYRPLRYQSETGITNIEIIAKLEYLNPTGSVKDRAALYMIEDAEKKGLINKDTIIIEPTSGNTGIGLAAIAASKGYKVILTLPDTMSVERRNLLKAYGAELLLTDGTKGMKGAIDKAHELHRHTHNSIILGQFENKANALAHFETTGPEIWEETNGKFDILVAGVGTGGTITGTGEYLKSKKPNLKVVAVEPYSSAVLSGKPPAPHKIQGIGAGFVPEILNTKIYDEVVQVSNEEAFEETKRFAVLEGIFLGISSGAALVAARKLAENPQNIGKRMVVILPDSGDRYLSNLFPQN